MNRKSKRKRNPIGCLSLLVIVLAVGAVVAFQALSPLFRRTAVIQTGGMGNQHQAEAVIVRDEELTDAEGVTSILYFADEGDLVYKGNKIAEIYSSGYSQTEVNKLDNIRQQIRQYHQEVILTSYADPQLERLDADVLARAQEVKLLIQRRGKGSLLNLQRQLAAALSARQT
ncbi:MAG: HlyD family efflux transporter periplasmic adaptor subunit, partial [Clostridia bacterium]